MNIGSKIKFIEDKGMQPNDYLYDESVTGFLGTRMASNNPTKWKTNEGLIVDTVYIKKSLYYLVKYQTTNDGYNILAMKPESIEELTNPDEVILEEIIKKLN